MATRWPLKTWLAAKRFEILANTGMLSRAHSILTRPDGASVMSFTWLKS
jgi:hypothetical protein